MERPDLPQGLPEGLDAWMARRQPPGPNIGSSLGPPRIRIDGRDDGPPGDRPPFIARDRLGPPGPNGMNQPWFMSPPWALGGSGLVVTLLVLFFVAVGLCLYLDRRRAKKQARQAAATGANADRGTSAEALRSMGSTAHQD